MNKLVLTIAVILSSLGLSMAQGAFYPVAPTGIPYSIVISGITLNGGAMLDSTEIAVFDDTLCVGTVEYSAGGNLQLVAWEGDDFQNLPGFADGDSMRFKVRLKVGSNYFIEEAVPTYSVGNGTFGYGSFTVLTLAVSSTVVGINETFPDENLNFYPNPFSEYLSLSTGGKGIRSIEFFNLQGLLLYREPIVGFTSEINIPIGNKIGNGVAGPIVAKIHTSNQVIVRKLMYRGTP